MRWLILLITCSATFFFSINLYSQNTKLLPMEEYAFKSVDKTVDSRDDSIGILVDNPQVAELFSHYILNGPDEKDIVSGSLRLLELKHSFLNVTDEGDFTLRLSQVRGDDNELVCRFKVLGNGCNEKGTIYLNKSEGKWLLSDMEMEN